MVALSQFFAKFRDVLLKGVLEIGVRVEYLDANHFGAIFRRGRASLQGSFAPHRQLTLLRYFSSNNYL
jgi:hypothetical protein